MIWTWRPMRVADLDAVIAIADAAFPDHPEDRACFEERLALSPATCFALASADQAHGDVLGYLVAYPWPLGAIPPLGGRLGALPEDRGTIYIHDLALDPSTAGKGLAKTGIAHLASQARTLGAARLALVAVNASQNFWRTHGFAVAVDVDADPAKLATYGPDAAYMVRSL